MSKSRFVFDKFAKLFEKGLINYKDLSDEILNIIKSKRDEIVFRMRLASKEEFEVLSKRIEKLEKQIAVVKKNNPQKKTKKVKKS